MTQLNFNIPGKLVLVGEWNVLRPEHSCITLPTQGIKVTIEPADVSCITSPTQNLHRHPISTLKQDSSPTAQFLTILLEQTNSILSARSTAEKPFHLTLENNPFTYVEQGDKRLKIGVGSSAGTAVGLIKAVTLFHGITLNEHELFNAAFTAHRRAAGGLGSGADVATAAVGKAILFRSDRSNNAHFLRDAATAAPQDEREETTNTNFWKNACNAAHPEDFNIPFIPSTTRVLRDASVRAVSRNSKEMSATQNSCTPTITPLTFPANWYFAVGFSGTSASTPRLIEAFNIAREQHPLTIKNILDQIETVVQQLAQLPPIDLAMRLINKNNELLAQLSQACDDVLETPPLKQMIQLAQDCGATAKFSGAGGGDCVIALCDSMDMKEEVHQAWLMAGFFPVAKILALDDASTTK